jgi:4-amino-4-deoxy-L-arabinose transferase-like glycosyltransferase
MMTPAMILRRHHYGSPGAAQLATPGAPPDGLGASVIHRLIWAVFAAIGVQALFATPYLSLELFLGRGRAPVLLVIATGTLALLLFALWRLRSTMAVAIERAAARLDRISAGSWILFAVVAGIFLRVAWVAAFPTPLESDGQVYFNLAKTLHERGVYRDPRGDYAYWPPGYPFLLYALIQVFGVHAWIPALGNLALYAVAVPITYALGTALSGGGGARVATLLLAIWPNHVFTTGTGSKELLLASLIPLALVAYLRAGSARTSLGEALLAALSGASLALASLTQPAVILLAGILPLLDVMRGLSPRRYVPRLAFMLGALVLLVGLWTFRNYRTLGEPVLIATNGGSVFYRANNPLATGGYTAEGERSLEGFPEVERNRLGLQWGMEWIRAHPGAFLKLTVRKQLLFLGDDGAGVYETMKRGLKIGGARYFLLKALSNGYWLLLWLLILCGLLRRWSERLLEVETASWLMLVVCYFYAIDSVFESGARHHVPLVGVIAVLAALAVRPPSEARVRSESGSP